MTGKAMDVITPILSADEMQFILDLCIEAGNTAVEMRSSADITTKSHAEDLVTSADKALSDLLITRLQARFPEDTVLSEEAPWQSQNDGKRRWIIDPIDGTKYYVDGTGKYCVMVGLIIDGREAFGCLYIPQHKVGFYGGPTIGAYAYQDGSTKRLEQAALAESPLQKPGAKLRILVSKNDLKANPWLEQLDDVALVTASSLGFDLYELHMDLADLFVHIRPTLGYWDTAAPGAVAQGMGLEVGTEEQDFLSYGYESPRHSPHVVIGKTGALQAWRRILSEKAAKTET